MQMSLDQIKSVAASLSKEDRAELTDFLLHIPEPDERKVMAEWLDLAEERMAEIRSGAHAGVPAEEAMRSLLESSE